jgi:hypothetical protein
MASPDGVCSKDGKGFDSDSSALGRGPACSCTDGIFDTPMNEILYDKTVNVIAVGSEMIKVAS